MAIKKYSRKKLRRKHTIKKMKGGANSADTGLSIRGVTSGNSGSNSKVQISLSSLLNSGNIGMSADKKHLLLSTGEIIPIKNYRTYYGIESDPKIILDSAHITPEIYNKHFSSINNTARNQRLSTIKRLASGTGKFLLSSIPVAAGLIHMPRAQRELLAIQEGKRLAGNLHMQEHKSQSSEHQAILDKMRSQKHSDSMVADAASVYGGIVATSVRAAAHALSRNPSKKPNSSAIASHAARSAKVM